MCAQNAQWNVFLSVCTMFVECSVQPSVLLSDQRRGPPLRKEHLPRQTTLLHCTWLTLEHCNLLYSSHIKSCFRFHCWQCTDVMLWSWVQPWGSALASKHTCVALLLRGSANDASVIPGQCTVQQRERMWRKSRGIWLVISITAGSGEGASQEH